MCCAREMYWFYRLKYCIDFFIKKCVEEFTGENMDLKELYLSLTVGTMILFIDFK